VLDRLVQGLKADSWATVHLPYGGTVRVDLDKALGSGGREGYRAWWVNPKNGGRASMNRGEKTVIEQGKGVIEFKSPSEGSLKDDWVLLLETYTT
jgi:hypothetical protein